MDVLTPLLETNHALSIENAAYRKWIAELVTQGVIKEDIVAGSQRLIKHVQDTEELSALRKENANIPRLEAELSALRTTSSREMAENARNRKELADLNTQVHSLRTKLAEMTSNTELIRAKAREEISTRALIDAQKRVDMQTEAMSVRLEAMIRENAELRAKIPTKDTTGKVGEATMMDYLRNDGLFTAVRDCSRVGGNLDIEVRLADKRAMVEVKTYEKTVSSRHVAEFENTILVQEPDVAVFVCTSKIAKKSGLTVEKHGPTAVIYYPEWNSNDKTLLHVLYATLASSGISRPDDEYWRQLHEAYTSERENCERQVRALQARIGQLVKKISDLDAKIIMTVDKPELSAFIQSGKRACDAAPAVRVKRARVEPAIQ
jgi:septal ring factor EnvC (AmiA/AmiB activator)